MDIDENIARRLLGDSLASNAGAHAKEFFLQQAENAYNNGDMLQSVFYQLRALFQTFQERYYQDAATVRQSEPPSDAAANEWLASMNDWERANVKRNPLIDYALQLLATQSPAPQTRASSPIEAHLETCNFLKNILDPSEGIQRIQDVCAQLPPEWTVLQLCKGPRTETTYSIFPKIHEHDAAIYLTLLRHARSDQFPQPVCLRFSGLRQSDIFVTFATINTRFKKCILVDPKLYKNKEAKKLYWKTLEDLDQSIATALGEFREFFFPWRFLFTGIPHQTTDDRFARVDQFCAKHAWETHKCVLLSLAALHVGSLTKPEISAISKMLANNTHDKDEAESLLLSLQGCLDSTLKHYPCVLIVDERLDHFFWEEMNVGQEYTRVNSLQTLWQLYHGYKARIHNGYLHVNITDGGCLVNPDNNLPKSELRMRRFFEYWMPHWLMKFTSKPTQDELLNDYFKRSCYVYAGHGSGLQYINGKYIARQQVNCVVFLFGCDSTRLRSNGLNSELIGPHLFYHAAMCPTLVGTLMPSLDSNMDIISTEILSRWIAPKTPEIAIQWDRVDHELWEKTGTIAAPASDSAAPALSTATGKSLAVANCPRYHVGSLCAVVARIHQRLVDKKYYNTVAYVCRGLPVWNCDVEQPPRVHL